MTNRFKGPPCPICNKDRTYSHKGNAAKAFKVNKPCHKTNKVRGVLCKTCNMGIGLLKDSLQILKNSVNYAERTFSDTRK